MKLSKARIVVTGAATILGRDVLNILAEQKVPTDNVVALESGRITDEVSYGLDDTLKVQSFDNYTFEKEQIVIHTGESRDAAGLARKASTAGAIFIDGSGTFALDPDVPLVVPEVNGALLKQKLPKSIIASPNSISIFLAMALNPLHIKAHVTRAVVSTYQAVSHWGREAQDELFNQTKAMFMAQNIKSEALPKQIAFNCYPMQGFEREDGLTDTEWQAIAQTKKILDPKIKLAVNTVTVPAFVSDGMMVNVECEEEVSPIKAGMWMTGQKGLGVIENGEDLPTHVDVSGEDFTYVARLRDDFSVDNGLSFWLIGDNLRKGSALNLVHIAEAYTATRD